MAEFYMAYEMTHINEMGYSRHPSDRGGETYNGIARNRWPDWPGWKVIDKYLIEGGSVDNISQDCPSLLALEHDFYRFNFWNKILGDSIPKQAIANEVYDSAVNLGVQRAGEYLQIALNCLNRRGTLYEDLFVDGWIGTRTIAALNRYLLKDKPELLLKLLNCQQGCWYMTLMRNDERQEDFARGWFSRVGL